mgnify:CR=1 FL=1
MKRLEIAQYIALGATCMTVLGFVINLATQSRWSMTIWCDDRIDLILLRRNQNRSENGGKDCKMGLDHSAVSV